ncbi:MAG: hypothetical protein WD055_02275 [Candidatus Dependentiae bacterium]
MKPKPKPKAAENISKQANRCGCSGSNFNNQPAAKHLNKKNKYKGIMPEAYYTREEATRIAAMQQQCKLK